MKTIDGMLLPPRYQYFSLVDWSPIACTKSLVVAAAREDRITDICRPPMTYAQLWIGVCRQWMPLDTTA
jgi:hypothetical protein